jgi:hypothetical protein
MALVFPNSNDGSYAITQNKDIDQGDRFGIGANKGNGSTVRTTNPSDGKSTLEFQTYNCQYCNGAVDVIRGYYRGSYEKDLAMSECQSNYSNPFGTVEDVWWAELVDINSASRCLNQCYAHCFDYCVAGCFNNCYERNSKCDSENVDCPGCYNACTPGCTNGCDGCQGQCVDTCYECSNSDCFNCTLCAGPGA